jgi:predicted transcriptional regulator
MERESVETVYRTYVIQSVERGIQDVAEGRTIPHEKVAADLRRKWLIDPGQKSDPE